MRPLIGGVMAVALACAPGGIALAQDTTPAPTTTQPTTSSQPTTSTQPNSSSQSTDANGNVNAGGSMNANGSMNTTNGGTSGPAMVPVHPADWQYQMMAKQYHWTTPPHSTSSGGGS